MTDDLLQRIERYYDFVPRATAHTESIGPFTLFIADTGWPFYARPAVGDRETPTVEDVRRVLDRQRELGIPPAFEWLDDVSPDVLPAITAAGLHVHRCPMMVLEGEAITPREAVGVEVRLLDPSEAELVGATRTSVGMAFTAGGVEVGADPEADTSSVGTVLDRMRDGLVVQATAIDRATGRVVGGGAHVPRPEIGVSELAGIGVRPSARRRGVGLAVAALLASDARSHGIATVFLSADSDDVARIYARTGFVRRGTSCIAEPAD